MMRNSLLLLMMCLLSSFAITGFAHELAPSMLSISEAQGDEYAVSWKTPSSNKSKVPLLPALPSMCEEVTSLSYRIEGSGVVSEWSVKCNSSLAGENVAVTGMEESGTSTLVKVTWLDGSSVQQVLTADKPKLLLPNQQGLFEVIKQYMVLGFEHILKGVDHLLFVLALLLLIGSRRQLILTISAFTLGHSITLSLVSLGFMTYPVSLIEFLIAISIFLMALELTKLPSFKSYREVFFEAGKITRNNPHVKDEVQASFVSRRSWLVALGFGLLHGMGFAGALKEVGLPADDIGMALLSFNVGIELGQLCFVVVVLLFIRITKMLRPSFSALGRWTSIYAIGALSVYWCIERGLSIFF